MKSLIKLIVIGIYGGIVLAAFLLFIFTVTGNQAYILLFNVDYIPLLKDLHHRLLVEILFHFTFCILSVIALYYILKLFQWEKRILPYVIVYTLGSSILYFLTNLTKTPPDASDYIAWIYWTFAHLIYSLVVGLLIKY